MVNLYWLILATRLPLFYKNKMIALHDISYLRFPETYSWLFRTYYKILIPLLLKTCKVLLTVSEFSKQEIANEYYYPTEKIHVVHNAVSDAFHLVLMAVELKSISLQHHHIIIIRIFMG